ncbi:MAG: YdeI/OmpD-associated family protein [Spirochaetales bacterium]|nr:YdeI/OmpD-associated family protein [Spirochaetales bacterium]
MKHSFEAVVEGKGTWIWLRIPDSISQEFSSRGAVAIEGRVERDSYLTVAEPDGFGGHWIPGYDHLSLPSFLLGQTLHVEVQQSSQWAIPPLSQDFFQAIQSSEYAISTWENITPAARWAWFRWVRSAHHHSTRQKRLSLMLKHLSIGKRRPCCFDQNRCTIPELSIQGKFLPEKKAFA